MRHVDVADSVLRRHEACVSRRVNRLSKAKLTHADVLHLPRASQGYGAEEFHNDLKALYAIAGVEGKPVVFLFTDSQIVTESFLEDINGILNSGEVDARTHSRPIHFSKRYSLR